MSSVPGTDSDVEDHSAYKATDGEAGCRRTAEECCAETDRNSEGDPVFAGGSHQASAIQRVATTVIGAQTATTAIRVIPSIDLDLSAFTVAGEGSLTDPSNGGSFEKACP